jgi:hypothetical protein
VYQATFVVRVTATRLNRNGVGRVEDRDLGRDLAVRDVAIGDSGAIVDDVKVDRNRHRARRPERDRETGVRAGLEEVSMLDFVQRALVLGYVPRAATVAVVDERLLVRPHLAVEMEGSAVVLVGLADLRPELGGATVRIDVIAVLRSMHGRSRKQRGGGERGAAQEEALHDDLL